MDFWTNQNNHNQQQYNNWNPNWYNYSGNSILNNRIQSTVQPNNIPVRVIFSPEQIAPQEIPTNGTPALFPLSDGSKIIARALTGNGTFDERIYVLQPRNVQTNEETVPSEFDQIMNRLGNIEENLGNILRDLYGPKDDSTSKKEVI